ncbi:MAG: hypothetical protein WA417_21520 [Stellaceae bacterium]
MKFHKNPIAGVAGAQIMQGENPAAGEHRLFDLLAGLRFQLAIQQLPQPRQCDVTGVLEHVTRNPVRQELPQPPLIALVA